MFKFSNKIEPLDVKAEQSRKPVAIEYEMATCLNTTKKESIKPLHVEVTKEEELPYLDLDLDFSEENLVKAMVYSEIFGKPKSKRRKQG
jgi:hypothetical protein